MRKDLTTGSAQRSVGRLFSKGGRLHLVLGVNTVTGMVTASFRSADQTEVIELPIAEVLERLSGDRSLKLDGLSAKSTEARVVEKHNGWFFRAREGEVGPYNDEVAAQRALRQHILSAQEDGRTGRPAQAVGE